MKSRTRSVIMPLDRENLEEINTYRLVGKNVKLAYQLLGRTITMSLAEEDDIFKESGAPLEDEEDEEEEEEEEDQEQDDNGENNEDEIDGDEEDEEDLEEDENEEDEDAYDANGNENGNDDGNDKENNEGDEDSKMTDANGDEPQTEGELPQDNKSKLQAFYNQMKFKSQLAESYDVNPFVAIPYSSAINAIALSATSKWLFTGGEDGFIRKYDFFSSVDGEVQLTAAQKHSLVDSITNGGALLGYWENEIPVKRSTLTKDVYEPKLSPVFSLAVENRCLWLLSGLSNGGINMQSIRHNEGTIVHHFASHQDTVSVLKLNQAQDKFISGSWDKMIHNWDLNTGEIVNTFKNATGQISSLEFRPAGGVDIEVQPTNEDDDMDSLFGDEDDEQPNGKQQRSNKQQHRRLSTTNSSTTQQGLDDNVFLSSSIDGSVNIWDLRTNQQVLRFKTTKGTPPWCVSSCWSQDGNFIYVGRRNSTVDEFSLRMPLDSNGETRVSKTLKFPQVSGAVTVVRPLPNGHHILCGSYDNIRIYDLRLYEEAQRKTPFLIVPGHHGGTLSDVQFDPTYRYMISASGNRGWQGSSTETVFVYDVELQ